MRETSITKRQPLSMGNSDYVFKVGAEERICFFCNEEKCNGGCKRFREEKKKLKARGKK